MRRALVPALGLLICALAQADGMPPDAPPAPQAPAQPAPAPASPGSWPVPDAQPVTFAVLVVSRQRLDTGTACDIDLYVQDQKVSRLQPEGEIALNLPPGPTSLRLATASSGLCHAGVEPLRAQSVVLRAGEVRKFRIANSASGLQLMPVPGGS